MKTVLLGLAAEAAVEAEATEGNGVNHWVDLHQNRHLDLDQHLQSSLPDQGPDQGRHLPVR